MKCERAEDRAAGVPKSILSSPPSKRWWPGSERDGRVILVGVVLSEIVFPQYLSPNLSVEWRLALQPVYTDYATCVRILRTWERHWAVVWTEYYRRCDQVRGSNVKQSLRLVVVSSNGYTLVRSFPQLLRRTRVFLSPDIAYLKNRPRSRTIRKTTSV